jgi:cytosine/adenosine deaminase-related metal-dependent hydrolase
LCIAEMLKSGTTTFLEAMLAERYGFDGIAQVVERSGIRACLGKIVMDLPGYAGEENVMHAGMIEDRRTSIDNTLAMHQKWHGAADGRLHVWFGARTPGSCSKDLYREVAALARERQMGITIHIGEVRDDVEYFRREFNQRPMEYCEEVGLAGPNVLLVHCCWLDEEDLADCARTGIHVSHNPSSNTKLASGFMKLPAALTAGVNVSLGCDGGPSNNSYDLIQEMKLAACIHKAVNLQPTVVPAETALEMATINGARALGLEDQIGSIEPGKNADLALINPDKLRLSPSPNPVSTLVYAANGDDVDSVMVDGRWLMRDRKLLTLDEDAVIAEARERSAKVYERAGFKLDARWPVI